MISKRTIKIAGYWLAILALLAAVVFVFWPGRLSPSLSQKSPAAAIVPPATNPVAPIARPPSPQELARRRAPFADFQKHPFATAHETAAFAWTAEDGKKPEIVRQFAHNELEFERLAEENDRIYRRQLVYAKETADMLVQQSRASGQPLLHLTLPGFDGQEFSVDVTRSDLNPSGLQGAFTGHVAGKLDSTVTLAFKNKVEAFTILSPSDNTYLVGEPREPGEIIVKSINPATYVVGNCGTP
jgi:hypothetical protein